MGEDRTIDLSGIDACFHADVAALHRNMSDHGVQRDDPVRSVFGLLGDRWSTLILLALSLGTWRHAELRRVLGRLGAEERISQRVLTLKLRTLEREGMVTRQVIDSIPPKVNYALSPLGRELHSKADQLIKWVNARESAIKLARAKFDQITD